MQNPIVDERIAEIIKEFDGNELRMTAVILLSQIMANEVNGVQSDGIAAILKSQVELRHDLNRIRTDLEMIKSQLSQGGANVERH